MTIKLFDRMIERHTRELSRILQQHIIENGGNLRVLLALDARFPAGSPEAMFENFQFIKLHSDFIERVAIVGRREWQRTCSGLLGLFGGVTLQYFDQSEIREAVKWLLAGNFGSTKISGRAGTSGSNKICGSRRSLQAQRRRKPFLAAIRKLIPFKTSDPHN